MDGKDLIKASEDSDDTDRIHSNEEAFDQGLDTKEIDYKLNLFTRTSIFKAIAGPKRGDSYYITGLIGIVPATVLKFLKKLNIFLENTQTSIT